VKNKTGSRLITTMTGTDLNIDLKSTQKKKLVLEVLENSDAITVFNKAAQAVLLKAGIPKEKITIIHQSVSLPETPYKDFRQLLNIYRDAVVFLMVGAIRRIKNVELAFTVLKELKHRFPGIHLIIAGPVIEDDAFRKLHLQIADEDWVTYVGEVARENIRSLFLSADVFLNTSFSESESNAMLEALSCRMIVVGRDIPGNTSLLTNDTGFLFSNKKDLHKKIIYIINNLKSMTSMRQKAATRTALDFEYAKEQDGYLELYKIILKKA
jgi:glycosyltransferase involved in cell wall biosynthesis